MSDATPSKWDDFLDVFIAPSRLFARRSDGKFGHAMLFFVIAAAVLYFLTKTAMQPIMDAEMARSMAASGRNLTPEQMEQAKKFTSIGAPIFLLIGVPITMLVIGAVVWGIGRAVGARLSYTQGATIATFAMFPRLVDSISGAVQALLLDEQSLNGRLSVSLGVGRFFDPVTANKVMLALVGRIDLFTIWVTVLIAIGIRVMGKTSTAQAAAGAVIVWLVGALPTLIQALR